VTRRRRADMAEQEVDFEALKAELRKRKRKAMDPLRSFVPSGEAQEKAFKSQALYRMLHGRNQGGKSYVASVEQGHYLRCTHPYRKCIPKGNFLCIMPSRKQATEVFGKYLLKESCAPGLAKDQPMLKPSEVDVTYDRTVSPPCPRRIVHRATGCSLTFMWASMGVKLIETLAGTQWDGAWIDENAVNQAIMDELMPRMMRSATEHRGYGGFVFWGATETKANQAQANFLDHCESPLQPDYEAFTLLAGDNAEAIDPEIAKKMLSGLSEQAKSIRLEGTGSQMDTVAIYPMLRDPKKAERIILDEPYVPHSHDNVYFAFDPGMDHPAGLMMCHVSPLKPRRIVVTKYIGVSGKPLNFFTDTMVLMAGGRKVRVLFYDKSGNKRDYGSAKTVGQQLNDLLLVEGLWANPKELPVLAGAYSHHHSGIAAVREFMDPAPHICDEPLLVFDKPTVENGLHTALKEMREYRGREDLNFTGAHGVIKKADEAPDCVRMLVTRELHWVDLGVNEPSKTRLPSGASPIAAMEPDAVAEETPAQKRQRDRMEASKALAKKHGVGRRGSSGKANRLRSRRSMRLC